MKDMPWLLKNNRYACLPVFSTSNDNDVSPPPSVPKVISPHTRRPRWESRLPKQYVLDVTSASERNHLSIKVAIETLDSRASNAFNALIDCGATGEFIDREYVRQKGFTTRTLSCSVPVYNVDGTPNQAGQITEVVELMLQYKDHSK